MKKLTELALTFLSARNPFDVSQVQYVTMLTEFLKTHGEDALQALAGFYIYCIDTKGENESEHAIKSTFAHDLNGRHDATMLPRSSSYKEFWEKEMEKKGITA